MQRSMHPGAAARLGPQPEVNEDAGAFIPHGAAPATITPAVSSRVIGV
ncbi:hypothetical protein BURKHO8Y_140206 [Burkholderia sp. 8Y]|nr:hypothetical protein [Burkholderia sp. 8Y]VXB53348.1 hypothetical protein BURKHO8Y_140206 [Burkholderia sp. 8Y]